MVNRSNKILMFAAVIFVIGAFNAEIYRKVAWAFSWTDPVITANSTAVRKVHIDELRTNINTKRQACGIGAYNWTDPVITAGVTTIRAVHINELRQAIKDAYSAAMATLPIFSDSTLTSGSTNIRAIHLTELRSATDNAPVCLAPCNTASAPNFYGICGNANAVIVPNGSTFYHEYTDNVTAHGWYFTCNNGTWVESYYDGGSALGSGKRDSWWDDYLNVSSKNLSC